MAKRPRKGPATEEPAKPVTRAGEKLQKVLARTGLGSRREMERWIEGGRVAVDGKTASLGDRVDDRANIAVDGKALAREPVMNLASIETDLLEDAAPGC